MRPQYSVGSLRSLNSIPRGLSESPHTCSAALSREQATTKMTAPPKDDWALDGHLECEARAAHQADPGYPARLERRHAWFGKAATAALCALVEKAARLSRCRTLEDGVSALIVVVSHAQPTRNALLS